MMKPVNVFCLHIYKYIYSIFFIYSIDFKAFDDKLFFFLLFYPFSHTGVQRVVFFSLKVQNQD